MGFTEKPGQSLNLTSPPLQKKKEKLDKPAPKYKKKSRNKQYLDYCLHD